MRSLSKQAKRLKEQVKAGDMIAARALVEHSVKLGQTKLAVRRFFLAQAMGAEVGGNDGKYCAQLISQTCPEALQKMAEEASEIARRYLNRKTAHG